VNVQVATAVLIEASAVARSAGEVAG
jgi:hypothetical protein